MPSWRSARVVAAIASVGKSAKQIEMSIAVMTSSTVFSKVRTSKVSSSRRKVIKLSEARLHEELSRCMYSEHGFEAVMRPASGLVCQSLIVLSYCRPGSAHSQAAVEILRNSSRASMVATTEPSARARSPKAPPSSTACMNSSLTRTELLAFWYCTDTMSLPPTSRTTIFAARRVAPPDLMVPADASAPRMKEIGPLAVPPEERSSLEDRMRERLSPAPEPPLKIIPSSRYQFRIESIVSSTARMKQALTCCGDAVPTLNHTGELKENTWCSSIQVSSCSKRVASSSVVK